MKLRILFLFCLIFTCIFAADYIYKHPQGPPTEFAAFKAPLPQETATHSGAAIIDIDLNENGNQNIEIPVDANEEFSISILSPIYQHLDIKILQPNSQLMSIQSLAKDITEDFGIDGARFPSHSFQFANPVKGVWQVMINCNDLKALQQLKSKLRTSNVPQGKIISSNYSPYKIEAHLASLETVKDGKVGFELRLVDSSKPKTSYLHDPIVGANIKAELEVDEPNGKEITVEMNDNGLFGDRVANDGIYYAQFNADQVGRYIAQMIVTGTDPEGKPLLRTTEITFNAVSDNIDITGAFANYDEQNQVFNIYLNLKTETLLKDSQPYRYKVWSEVWGKTSNGQYVSVGWVNGFTELEKATNGQIVLGRVELNHRWLVLAKVVSDLQLRNLRVSDADWSVIIDNIASLDVQASIPKLRLSQRDPPLDVITDSMKYGYETENYKNKFSKSAALNFKVLLIHGYCAKTQPFPAAEFTNAVEFTGGLSLSLSNDEFSRRIISFLMAQQINSSSFIAHSQGGMVSVHTLNYYVTPLDQAVQTQQRIIQTVGTPYQGSNLAGSVAGLGEIFGIGCGSNNDLSLNGAQSWLSGISPDSRKYSNYYYTQYQTGNLINYCNLAANSVLKWPNDGTTEVIYADLQGGQSQGKAVVGWCHTTDMRSTAQYLDSSRNRAMNTYANSASK